MENLSFDVVVVGGGNAALCAALAAAEQGASVALLERAPEEKRGGNSKFTGGGFRMVHHGAQDIKRVVPDLSDADIARTDFGEYSAEEDLDELGRITQYYTDPDLAERLVRNSTDTVHWLMGRGVKFLPNYGRGPVTAIPIALPERTSSIICGRLPTNISRWLPTRSFTA